MNRRSALKASIFGFLAATFSKVGLTKEVFLPNDFRVFVNNNSGNSTQLKEKDYVVTQKDGWTTIKLKEPQMVKAWGSLSLWVGRTKDGHCHEYGHATYVASENCRANVAVTWYDVK